MKHKSILVATLLATSVMFSACDEDSLNNLLDSVGGKATFTVSNTEMSAFGDQNVNHPTGDSIIFKSVLADVADQEIYVGEVEGEEVNETVTVQSFLALGSGRSLSTTTSEVAYPLFGIKVAATEPGTYELTENLLQDQDFISNLDSEWTRLLSRGRENLLLMADNDSNFYISCGGSITFDNLPEFGGTITGTLNNVEVRFIRVNDLNRVKAIINRLAEDPTDEEANRWIEWIQSGMYEYFFPKQTLNGTFECVRANVVKMVEKIQTTE